MHTLEWVDDLETAAGVRTANQVTVWKVCASWATHRTYPDLVPCSGLARRSP